MLIKDAKMAVEFDGERMVKTSDTSDDVHVGHRRQPYCACTSFSCSKLFLFMYSCAYVVIGGGLLLLGIWIELQSKDYETINGSLFIPAILLMSVGFLVIINSLCGVSGVVRESTCLLRVFLLFTVLSFSAQVAIGVLAFVYRQEIPDLVSDNFMFLIRGYHDNTYYKTALDSLQAGFQCCGFESYMDYEENVHFQCGSDPLIQKCGVPWTCCKGKDGGGLLRVDCGYQLRWNSSMPVDKIYTMGCINEFQAWLSWNLDLVGVIGLGTAIPQIIGILLVYFFIRQVKELKMWYRVGM